MRLVFMIALMVTGLNIQAQRIDTKFGENGSISVPVLEDVKSILEVNSNIFINDFERVLCYTQTGEVNTTFGDDGKIEYPLGEGKQAISGVFEHEGTYNVMGCLMKEWDGLFVSKQYDMKGNTLDFIDNETFQVEGRNEIIAVHKHGNGDLEFLGYRRRYSADPQENNQYTAISVLVDKDGNLKHEDGPFLVYRPMDPHNIYPIHKVDISEEESMYFFRQINFGFHNNDATLGALTARDKNLGDLTDSIEVHRLEYVNLVVSDSRSLSNDKVLIVQSQNAWDKRGRVLSVWDRNTGYDTEVKNFDIPEGYSKKHIAFSKEDEIILTCVAKDDKKDVILCAIDNQLKRKNSFGEKGVFRLPRNTGTYVSTHVVDDAIYVVTKAHDELSHDVLRVENQGSVSVSYLAHEDSGILYPNPASGHLFLKNHEEYEKVEVFDASGKHVRSWKASSVIQVDGLKAGVYQLRVLSKDGATQTESIVVQ